jgi:uncharacterized membrane protein YbhN (UPF0104 family)
MGTFLSIAFLVYLLTQQNWREVANAISQIPLGYLGFASLMMVISRFLIATRWHALLRIISQNVKWSQTLKWTFSGLFATNLLPTTIGGDIVRFAGGVQSGLDSAKVAASLVTDRLVGMFGMILVLPLGLMPLFSWFSTQSSDLESSISYGNFIFSAGMVKKAWNKIFRFIRKIVSSLTLWLAQPKSLLSSFVLTGIHMVCFFSIFWILFLGLEDPISFALVAGLYGFVYLITLLPVSINGYGLQEVSISVIFSQVGGVSLQNSLSVALIFRTLTILASLPGAFFLPGIISGNDDRSSFQDMDGFLGEDVID